MDQRARKPSKNSLDEASNHMLYQGCNLSQLSIIFKKDHRVLKERMYGIPPFAKRGGIDVWQIRDVAPVLVDIPAESIEQRIRTMNHADLPKMLTKEYWAGQRSKQIYELAQGDLWETEKVVKKVSEAFKILKMSLMKMGDTIEKTSEMTDKQKDILMKIVDSALTDLHNSLVTNLLEDDEDGQEEEL